ncbi:MAG: hypothetical protein AAF417_11790 [Pseudomonadota bacterium]
MSDEVSAWRRFFVAAVWVAAFTVVVLAGLRGALMDSGLGNGVEFAAGALSGLVAIAVALLLARLLVTMSARAPDALLVYFIAVLLALVFLARHSPAEVWRTVVDTESWTWPYTLPNGLAAESLVVLVLGIALVAGAVALVVSGRWGALGMAARVGALTATAVFAGLAVSVVVGLASDGSDPFPVEHRLSDGVQASSGAQAIANPAVPGPAAVRTYTYGAGENARRPEFGEDRDWESRTVDASPLLPEWKGLKARMREWYWGFDLEAAPLNGTVWAPASSGPAPLVLIVHGNHGMEEVSDPGYAYLGELLASHGMVAVSVDENYINGSWSGDFRGKEMPLRAWLLLEHLRLWREWNAEPSHPLAGRVDLDNVALVGHSRGGEALPIAFMLNELAHYPDDATVELDYGFGIKSLIAIAQVDQRYHRRLRISDVNFLALQGSYDSDEPAFHGMRQYHRTTLGPDVYRFKAGLYLHRANHGQFNSIWGREDTSPPYSWLLNLAPLVSPEDQQQVARVYVNAFLKATLLDAKEYVALFRDPRVGVDWLPDLPYVQQFNDSTMVPIANFEEDLDVLTASAAAGTITARGFSTWREEELRHRDERRQGSNAVVLGWEENASASYEIRLPVAFSDRWSSDRAYLTLSISGSTERPAQAVGNDDSSESDDEDDASTSPLAPSFRLEVEDRDGRTRAVHSSDVAHLAPPLRVRYLKHQKDNDAQYKDEWEPVLQYLELPLERVLERGEDGALSALAAVRLNFAGEAPGVVIVDDIALRIDAANEQENPEC